MKTSRNGKIVFFLGFHSELNVGRNVVKVVKERVQEGMVVRLNNEGILNKLKPTFEFQMEVA